MCNQMKKLTTKPISKRRWEELGFSQDKVSGFLSERYQTSKVLMIGAGGIGSLVGLALTRKGLGFLDIFDDDDVELKNLTRQFFMKKDIGKNKAIQLVKMLVKQGLFKTTLQGFPYRFQEALEMKIDMSGYDLVICGVDNNPTRVSVARYCLEKKIPLILCAVSRDASTMYCAIQEPGKVCFGCIFPNSINDDSYPCNLPGIIDINQVVAGFCVYAVDTVLMNRHREWNFKFASLDGSIPDSSKIIEKNPECILCSEMKIRRRKCNGSI